MPIVEPHFAKPEQADKRRVRQSRLLRAEIISPRAGRFSATVRNISGNGIGGKAPIELDWGERVQVELPGLMPLVGTVRWSFEGQFGIETDQTISLDALRSANGGTLPAADQSVQFHIQRPVAVASKRPAVGFVSAPYGQGTPVKDSWAR
jgi:PilZ domain